MVDDNEFIKRRHLSRGRPRKYDPTTADSTNGPPSSENNNFPPFANPNSNNNVHNGTQ